MSHPQTALAYAETSTDPEEKRALLTGVALGWGEKDGAAAFTWATSTSADAATRADLVAAATLFWANTHPDAATPAALSQPADLQARALSTIASSLYQRDPASTAAWLAKLPDGTGKNAAAKTRQKHRVEGIQINNADGSTTLLAPEPNRSR